MYLITLCTPTAENVRAASALPFHLASHRPAGTPLTVLSLNTNAISADHTADVEDDLDAEVRTVPLPWWWRFVPSPAGRALRCLLPLPVNCYLRLPKAEVERIRRSGEPVWIYGEDLARLARLFPTQQVVVTGPDCEALYYRRALALPSLSPLARLRYRLMLGKYERMSRRFPANARYHLVGQADAQRLQALSPALEVHFIRHPHYACHLERDIRFALPKTRVIIIGRNDFFMGARTQQLVEALASDSARDLTEHFSITFLGRGWEQMAYRLQRAGYKCRHIVFADDYLDTLDDADIQITPVGVGTGTKGRVLDGMAGGLLAIGTERALENIAARDGEECIVYHRADEAIEALRQIAADPARYERMATAGRQAVLTAHSPAAAARAFFALFRP